MTRKLYFDAPVGGLDANSDVLSQFQSDASRSSPTSGDRLTFQQRGSDRLVVFYDDDGGEATQTSVDALVSAVKNVYGVSHRRTVDGE